MATERVLLPANRVVVVQTNHDWQGLYLNTILMYEGHEVTLADIQRYIPLETTIGEISEVFIDTEALATYLERTGQLPENLKGVGELV